MGEIGKHIEGQLRAGAVGHIDGGSTTADESLEGSSERGKFSIHVTHQNIISFNSSLRKILFFFYRSRLGCQRWSHPQHPRGWSHSPFPLFGVLSKQQQLQSHLGAHGWVKPCNQPGSSSSWCLILPASITASSGTNNSRKCFIIKGVSVEQFSPKIGGTHASKPTTNHSVTCNLSHCCNYVCNYGLCLRELERQW